MQYRVHDLKVWPAYYQQLETGEKTCELRVNDRDYQVGDVLLLREYDPTTDKYTGQALMRRVSHIMAYPTAVGGLVPGWCLLSLHHVDPATHQQR